MSQIFEVVRCPDCSFHKPKGEPCPMCRLLREEES